MLVTRPRSSTVECLTPGSLEKNSWKSSPLCLPTPIHISLLRHSCGTLSYRRTTDTLGISYTPCRQSSLCKLTCFMSEPRIDSFAPQDHAIVTSFAVDSLEERGTLVCPSQLDWVVALSLLSFLGGARSRLSMSYAPISTKGIFTIRGGTDHIMSITAVQQIAIEYERQLFRGKGRSSFMYWLTLPW